MSVAILELNDANLHLLDEDGGSFFSSGYISFGEEVLFGEEAKAHFWLHPGRTDAKFWTLLGTTPWTGHQLPVRHRADMAYAQLKMLWDRTDATDLIVLVPASVNKNQLGLLVGMCQALPNCTVSAVASNALLASLSSQYSQDKSEFLLLDLGLHQIESHHICASGSSLSETSNQIFSDLGQIQLEASVGQYVANRFIDLHRYDPQHTATGDQSLHNALPNWLNELHQHTSTTAILQTSHGEVQLGLQSNEIRKLLSQKLATLIDYLTAKKLPVCVSPKLWFWLAFLKPELQIEVLPENCATENASKLTGALIAACQPLHRINQLSHETIAAPVIKKPNVDNGSAPNIEGDQSSSSVNEDTKIATHILIDNVVHSIDGLRLAAIDNDGVAVADNERVATHLLRVKNNLIWAEELEANSDKNVIDSINLSEKTAPKASLNTRLFESPAVAGSSVDLFKKSYLLVNMLNNEK